MEHNLVIYEYIITTNHCLLQSESMRRSGFLLIEMIIALATIAVMSLIIAHIQVCIMQWHKEAEQHLMATNLAQLTLAKLQKSEEVMQPDHFRVQVHSYKIRAQVPFIAHSVTISFKTSRGITKEITIDGGSLDEKA